ncbi:MAG: hypothetical protein SFU83_18690 [Meiothermus sp.]|nr:hypothetical protein [Meiothermus sp.]
MNHEIHIQFARMRQQALLAERSLLAQTLEHQSWVARVQNWLFHSEALFRAAALNR